MDAHAGDVYLLRLAAHRTGGFTPRVEVYVPGSRFASPERLTAGSGVPTFTAPASGAYNVIAFDGYRRHAKRRVRHPSGPSEPALRRLLRAGLRLPRSGSITQPLQSGMFSYSTSAGDAFTCRLIDTGGSLQSALQVYDPRGLPVPVVAGAPRRWM